MKIIAEFGRPPCGRELWLVCGNVIKVYLVVPSLYVLFAGSFDDEPTCGRPLGLRFDTNGKLVVIDAYLGLYSLDVDTGIGYRSLHYVYIHVTPV